MHIYNFGSSSEKELLDLTVGDKVNFKLLSFRRLEHDLQHEVLYLFHDLEFILGIFVLHRKYIPFNILLFEIRPVALLVLMLLRFLCALFLGTEIFLSLVINIILLTK